MKFHDIVDVTLHIHHETDKAILASENGNKKDAVWLPKSQIEIDRIGNSTEAEIQLPEWLAEEKGLL